MKNYCRGIVLVLFLAGPCVAQDDSQNFFDKDAAKSVFGPEVQVIKAGRPKPTPVVPEAKQAQAPTGTPGDPFSKENFDPKKIDKRALLERFGNPQDEAPIVAQDNAPKPFRAMMMALEMGDDDLAFQYARQYTRFLSRLQGRTSRFMSVVGAAMERESLDENGAWKEVPRFEEDKIALERDLKASGIAEKDPALEARTRALLERAQKAEGAEGTSQVAQRDALQGQAAPEENQGPNKLDVYFFFDPQDPASRAMLPAVEALYRNRHPINLIGLTITEPPVGMLKIVRDRTHVTMPLENGQALAQAADITRGPTIVIRNLATGVTKTHEGVLTAEALEQLIMGALSGRQGAHAPRR